MVQPFKGLAAAQNTSCEKDAHLVIKSMGFVFRQIGF